MSDPAPASSGAASCWKLVGVWGDGTCPELPRVGHCHNCEVYVAAGRTLLDRPAPDDYVDQWTQVVAADHHAVADATVPYVVFRLGLTWFALQATTFREIAKPGIVRRLPHRTEKLLLGLVNVRGELYPCVSLHALLGETPTAADHGDVRGREMLVLARGADVWVSPADAIDGMCAVIDANIDPVPATLARTHAAYTRGLFRRGDMTVAIIDEELLFAVLARGLS